MRAPSGPAVLTAALVAAALVMVVSQEEGGYYAEEFLDDPVDLVDNNVTCPSEKVLRSRETCDIDGVQVQCIKVHCCDSYKLIAGRCIPNEMDPCGLQLCEQACLVRDARIWCSCHRGFRFDAGNYRMKTQPYCVDVDECLEDNGGCEQSCTNDPGGFHCSCRPPYTLARDGRSCETPFPSLAPTPLPLVRASRCYASCDTAYHLARKVKQLTDQVLHLQTSMQLLIERRSNKDPEDMVSDDAHREPVFDSIAPLHGNYCRCERGPRGPAGPPGMEGPKGDAGPRGPRGHRGPKGSLDLMLLLLADVKHDIKNLEARVYKDGEQPERFNLQKAWRRQRKQENRDMEASTDAQSHAQMSAVSAAYKRATGATTQENVASSGVQITPNGITGEISQSSSEDPTPTSHRTAPPLDLQTSLSPLGLPSEMDENLKEFHRLAAAMNNEDDEEIDTDYDYSFY